MVDKYLRERQKILELVADGLMARAKKLSYANDQEVLLGLIQNLKDFSARHADYFGSEEASKSTPSSFTLDYTYRVLANQFGHDLSVIEQVIAQRENPALQLTLEVSDTLAQQMLQPAIEAGFFKLEEPFDKPIALTYLQKSASIRVIPYAPVALIGIPYSCLIVENKTAQSKANYTKWTRQIMKRGLSSDLKMLPPLPDEVHVSPIIFDFLAVPHEIGHYVFRFGRMPESARNIALDLPPEAKIADSAYLFRAIPGRAALAELNIPPFIQRWAEEIFADMYGCRVAGPFITLDFQDLLLGNYTLEGFSREDDGDHPLPALRPEIYHLTLDSESIPNGPKWASHFRERWASAEAVARSRLDQFKADGEHIFIEDAEPRLKRLVRHLKPILQHVRPGVRFPPFPSKAVDASIVDAWTQYFRETKDSSAQKLLKRGQSPSADLLAWRGYWEKAKEENWKGWQERLVQDSEKLYPLPGETDSERAAARLERKWRVTLNWMSWTTEGPDKDPPTGI